ncbi:MAG: DUF1508 domain-containing protein [Nitrospinae bacterium]|nr:DUF1508 domain-containing protein [Nitrospinota bacterium]
MAAVKNAKHRPVEIFRDRSGRHRFRVRARNGRVLASGQAYAQRSGARKGAAALLRVLQQVAKAGDSLVNEEKSCSPTNS